MTRPAVDEIGPAQRAAAMAVHRAAFSGDTEAALVSALLDDASAAPLVSFGAWDGNTLIGHVMFSAAGVGDLPAALLAPLAVLPDWQARGVGSLLVRDGIARCRDADLVAVFVFGDPNYYARFGFAAAHEAGFPAPHPVDESMRSGWQVLVLRAGLDPGTVAVCDSFADPQLW